MPKEIFIYLKFVLTRKSCFTDTLIKDNLLEDSFSGALALYYEKNIVCKNEKQKRAWLGNTAANIYMHLHKFYVRNEVTEPGCIYEISVETDVCTKIVSGPGEQNTIQRCGDEYQCCAITYEVCYEWSCVGENCPLRLSRFTKLTQNVPTNECPFYCGSYCNEWGQSWSLEPYGKKSETNNNDINELELQISKFNNMLNILNRTNKPQSVSFEVI